MMPVMTDNEQPRTELVKCVVVGDTAVGKTKLIAARACNTRMTWDELLNTHIPTVWAIDQYRMYEDVLERSRVVVDGVNVSIRLWDTFGDHEKDRKFAYGRSDVVLLCFSIANPKSLQHCKAMWYPEIRRYLGPNTPVLLIGCKSDLRYMYCDRSYVQHFKNKSPFIRPVRKEDLITPEVGRSLAKELGVYYYETSVLSYYGVHQVFENACRAALVARRNTRFWMTNLKKVQKPLLQCPYLPPKPVPNEVSISPSTYEVDLSWLHEFKPFTDVVFMFPSGSHIRAHRFILAAASPFLHKIFTAFTRYEMNRSLSDSSLSTLEGESDFEKSKAPKSGEIRRQTKSFHLLLTSFENNLTRNGCQALLTNGVFMSVKLEKCDGSAHDCYLSNCFQTIIRASELYSSFVFENFLQFVYTGCIGAHWNKSTIRDLEELANFMQVPELSSHIRNLGNNESTAVLKQLFQKKMRESICQICVIENLFSDVTFQLEDRCFGSHRALLCARCDFMRAMFFCDFLEKKSATISLPGICADTFYEFLVYICMDDLPRIRLARCLDTLELANRFCSPRLLNLIEKSVVEELSACSQEAEGESFVIAPCLKLLETTKMHNAHQISEWCMIYLCVNYNKLCKMSPNSLRNLHSENREFLIEHRWPPVWYLKDADYYAKRMLERQKEGKIFKGASSSCLCFGGSRREYSTSMEGGENEQIPLSTTNTTATWGIR